MSPISELGPLDPVIQLDEEGTTVPGFAIRRATRILEKEVEVCKDPEIRRLKAEHILGPIAVKIEPYLLSAVYDMPDLATNYGKKILQSRKYSSSSAERICKTLTELGHPSHGYVVDLEEAKNLDLRVKEMPQKIEELSSTLLLALNLYESALRRNGHPLTHPYIRIHLKEEKKKRSIVGKETKSIEKKKNKRKAAQSKISPSE